MTVTDPNTSLDPAAPLKITGYDGVEPSRVDDGRITITFTLSRNVTDLEDYVCEQISSYQFDLFEGRADFTFGPMAVEKIPDWLETLDGQLAHIESEAQKIDRRMVTTLHAAHDVLATLKF